VQHTERNALLGPIQIYSGAEVSHTNWCQSVGTLRHYNLVPKCPGAEVSWCRSVPRAFGTSAEMPWTLRHHRLGVDSAQIVFIPHIAFQRKRPPQWLPVTSHKSADSHIVTELVVVSLVIVWKSAMCQTVPCITKPHSKNIRQRTVNSSQKNQCDKLTVWRVDRISPQLAWSRVQT